MVQISAFLSAVCTCGALWRCECPHVSDIPAALAAKEAAGWGFDARGAVQCPECAQGAPRTVPGAKPAGQSQLSLPGVLGEAFWK